MVSVMPNVLCVFVWWKCGKQRLGDGELTWLQSIDLHLGHISGGSDIEVNGQLGHLLAGVGGVHLVLARRWWRVLHRVLAILVVGHLDGNIVALFVLHDGHQLATASRSGVHNEVGLLVGLDALLQTGTVQLDLLKIES